jgi:hypothetical protein
VAGSCKHCNETSASIKGGSKVAPLPPCRRQEGKEYSPYSFLASALDAGQRHAPAALYSLGNPGTHRIRGWVGPRAGLVTESRGKKSSSARD